jgi:cytochrome c553
MDKSDGTSPEFTRAASTLRSMRGQRRSPSRLPIRLSIPALCLTIGLVLSAPLAALAQGAPGSSAELELGRRIYNDGLLASGAPLTGTRFGESPVTGAAAACVACHRRSGMGQVEGNVLIQPITGDYLFAPSSARRLATMDPHISKQFNQAHDPYTDQALSVAIMGGLDNRGRSMSVAMPRYDLSPPDLKALTAYLKQLSSQWSPGVTETNIRFATVITPDVDPARRKAFVDMMRSVMRQKNASTVTARDKKTRHHMTTAAEMILGTERRWDLDIWELQGAPETWGAQLAARYRAKPVFALLSGISESTWQPVHDFCDREQVPCWFPSVDVPGEKTSEYAFYFSGGVTLEAAVLARHLKDQKAPPKRAVQIYREGTAGRAAAQAFAHALAGSGIAVADRVLKPELAAADALRQALGTLESGDAAVFWLRPDDVGALDKIKPVQGKSYFSGFLAHVEQAPLPASWRERSYLIYPYELPENRPKNLEYFHTWMNSHKMPLVDEAMQSEVYFALNFMTDTVSEMLDNLYRDYLVERGETMLSKREGMKSAQETRDRLALGRVGDMVRKHGPNTVAASARIPITPQQGGSHINEGTTMYTRLGLAPQQRFASKTGYIVRFADASGKKLVAESELIVP